MPKIKINDNSTYFRIASKKDDNSEWTLGSPGTLKQALENMGNLSMLYAKQHLMLVVELPIKPPNLVFELHPVIFRARR